MSIFERIYDIARAEMRHHMPGESQKWKVKGEWSYQPPPEDDAAHGEDPHGSGGYQPPPEEPPKDPLAAHYAALEAPPGSDFETVRKAWKNQLRKYHPDRYSADPEKQKIAHQVTQDLNRSYTVLKKHLRGK